MAALVNAPFIGAHYVAPSTAEIATLAQYDKALGSVGHDQKHKFPASSFPWFMALFTPANNNTKSSVVYKAPHPIRIWAVDAACESAAGSAATVDVHQDPAGGTSFDSILSSAIDVKTTAGTAVRAAPNDDECDQVYGTSLKLVVVGTGSGDVVGAQAALWCQRL